jgi:hypothetical protein
MYATLCREHWSPENFSYFDDFVERAKDSTMPMAGHYSEDDITDEMKEFGQTEFGGVS